MECVRARAGDDVDDTAGGTSSLCSVAVGLDGDLLNTFDVRLDTDGADDALVVVDAVYDPVAKAFVLSVDREAGCVGAAIIWAATARESVALAFVGARNESDELNEVTTV